MLSKITPSEVPILTVAIVVLNREWIVGKMLNSLCSQTYPHNRMFVVMVDGASKDRTVEIARKVLEKSDFMSYEIIVKECTIPDGRNICIEKMQGDMLLFWDSDVVMEPNAIEEFVKVMIEEKADISTADAISIYLNAVEEVDTEINEAITKHRSIYENQTLEVPFAGMGHTLISRNVLDSIRFDSDLTIAEDSDFSVRAREKGFRIFSNRRVLVFDINMRKKRHSDIYVDMPLEDALRGLRKKAKAKVLGYTCKLTFRKSLEFFVSNNRYLFYLGYIPTTLFTIWGALSQNFVCLTLPIYLLPFALWQAKRRGFRQGIKAVLRSIIVGVPFSLLLIYYFCRYTS